MIGIIFEKGVRDLTRDETKRIIRIMCDSYPNYKPTDLAETIDVWAMMLEEYTYEQISVALKTYVLSDTSGFAPSVGQLVSKVQTFTQPQELNEMEAWALVSRAIRNSGYNSESEYAKLPAIVQAAVGMPSQLRQWALDENYNEEVVMSQFQRCYRTELKRQEEFQKLPSNVQMLIQNASKNSPKSRIQEKRENTAKYSLEEKDALKIENKIIKTPMPERAGSRLKELGFRKDM